MEEVSDALVIAPWWQTAHWYPLLLQLLVQRPILLPQWHVLLTLPQKDSLHPLKDVMRLTAWHVFGITYRSEEVLQGQQVFLLKSWLPGTGKQYLAAWKCFCCWYCRKQRNPLQADLRTVVIFSQNNLRTLISLILQ